MLSHCVDGRRIFQFQPKSFLRPLKSLSRWRDEKFTEGEKNVYFSVFVLRFAYFSNSIKSLRRLSILFFHGPFRSSVYVVFFPALRDERNSNETRGNFHTNRSWAEEIHNKLFFSSLSLKIVLKSPLQSFHVPELFSRPTDFRQIKVLHSGCIFSLFTSPRSESVNEMMVESCTLDNTGKSSTVECFCTFYFSVCSDTRLWRWLERMNCWSTRKTAALRKSVERQSCNPKPQFLGEKFHFSFTAKLRMCCTHDISSHTRVIKLMFHKMPIELLIHCSQSCDLVTNDSLTFNRIMQ